MFDSNTVANYYADSSDFYLLEACDFEKVETYHKPLIPKPQSHKCKNGTIVCLNYDKPYNSQWNRMTDSHLLNTIKFIENNGIKYVESLNVEDLIMQAEIACCQLNGDMAINSIESEIRNLIEYGIDKYYEYKSYLDKFNFKNYVNEAKNRQLSLQLQEPFDELNL